LHTSGCIIGQNSNGTGRRQHSSLSTRSFERFEEDFNRLSANNTPTERGTYLNDSNCELN
jgi:hypothetical protein